MNGSNSEAGTPRRPPISELWKLPSQENLKVKIPSLVIPTQSTSSSFSKKTFKRTEGKGQTPASLLPSANESASNPQTKPLPLPGSPPKDISTDSPQSVLSGKIEYETSKITLTLACSGFHRPS